MDANSEIDLADLFGPIETELVARRFLQVVSDDDTQSVAAMLAADVVLRPTSDTLIRGRAQVLRFLKFLSERHRQTRVTVHALSVAGSSALVQHTTSWRCRLHRTHEYFGLTTLLIEDGHVLRWDQSLEEL